MSPPSSDRHLCHCGRGFLRKEHLRRHQATHASPSFICHVCQRSFTRSDLLRRHLTLHDVATSSDSKRVRACDACHTSKIRCDGGARCSLCTKRGIDCIFTRGNASNPPRQGPAASSTRPLRDSPHSLDSHSSGTEPSTVTDPRLADVSSIPVSHLNFIGHGNQETQRQDTDFIAAQGLKLVLEAVSNPFRSPPSKCEPKLSPDVKDWSSACVKTYIDRFHDRWPVIHAPTFERETDVVLLRATVVVIGAWFQNDDTSRSLILDIYSILMKRILDELTASTIDPGLPWPVEICQAALLIVIFAFESGQEKSLTKARLLYSLLVTVLRQNKIFSAEALEQQMSVHFPGDFPPWALVRKERWKRLATCAFKIDTYLSLFANQPPLLQREELDLGLTSTFAMWNAHGLDVFFRRYPSEPLERSRYKICDLALGSQQPIPSGVLVEDIQIRMMGTTSYVWILSQMRRNPNPAMCVSADQKEMISARLKRCKLQLDCVAGIWKDPDLHQQHLEYLLRAYSGDEDASQDGWEKSVQTRFFACVFSATMLYHLFSLHIYADVHTFIHDLPCLTTPDLDVVEEIPLLDHRKRMEVQEWALSTDSRAAVIHAIFAYREYDAAAAAPPDLQAQVIDHPLAYAALSAGAAVLWTWAMNSSTTAACTCMGMPLANGLDLGFVSLEAGESPEVEHWILNGGNIALHGVHICRCNVDVWLVPFAAILSHGARTWEIGDVFARKLWAKLGVQP